MEKIQSFFVKHRAIIAFVVCLIIFAVLFVFHYKDEIEDRKDTYVTSYIVDDGNVIASQSLLTPGNTVIQTFVPQPGEYSGLAIEVATFSRVNDGSVSVTVEGNGMNKTWQLDCAGFEDNSNVPLMFDEPVTVGENCRYKVTIKSSLQNAQLCPAIYSRQKTETSPVTSKLTVNGKELNETLRLSMIVASKGFLETDYLVLGAAFALGLIIIFALMLSCKKLRIENIVFVLILMIGTGYMFVMTPMSAPDEYVHYVSAYSYSNKLMGDKSDADDGINMRNEDFELHQTTPNNVSSTTYYKLSNEFNMKSTDSQIVKTVLTPMQNRGLAYAFQAVGITIGRLMNLGAYPTYYLGRIFNLILFALCVLFSIKIMPFGKISLAVIAMLPMSMHLAASYSYDVYTIGMCMLLFAQLMKLLYSKEKITFWQFALTAVIAFLAIPYKVAYAGIACIALMIPKENFKNKKQHFVFKTLIILAGVVGILIMQRSMFSRLTNEPQALSWDETQTKFSIGYILDYPLNALSLFCRTFVLNGSWYFKTMIGSALGWFQIPVPEILLTAFVVLLVFSFIKKKGEPDALRPLNKWYTAAVMAGTIILVVFLLMLDWTPITSKIVLGVQGRYFLPVLPLMLLVFRSDSIVNKADTDRPVLFASLYLNVLVLLSTFVTAANL